MATVNLCVTIFWVWVDADEQAIVAGDIEKLDAFVSKIPDTPATD